jgi:hypothetical protein
MIQIHNLTQDQVDMLDHMWSLDSEEDYLMWYDLLDEQDQQQADLLMRMIILAEVDNDMEEIQDLSLAKEALKKFALH